jgi:hypothetical protein
MIEAGLVFLTLKAKEFRVNGLNREAYQKRTSVANGSL